MDNAVDEFKQTGTRVVVDIDDNKHVFVRNYSRGIPHGTLVSAVTMLNTGGKFGDNAYKKSVGLNGVGIKLVNGLSIRFEAASFRNGKVKRAVFERGVLQSEETVETNEPNGMAISFDLDPEMFHKFQYQEDIIQALFKNYIFLNAGLIIVYNGNTMTSKGGLKDLLLDKMERPGLYDIVHFRGNDIEIAFTHTDDSEEVYYSYINGQYTSQGGAHQSALKEYLAKVFKDFYNKNYDNSIVRSGLVAAISLQVQEPMFEGNTKTKFYGNAMTKEEDGTTVNKFVSDFVTREVDNYLHKNKQMADTLLERIKQAEKEAKKLAVIKKQARERIKRVSLHNSKLRDCKIHLNDTKGGHERYESSVFITEGDSASGSITKVRDVATQAVFSLRGKPLNTYGLSKRVIYMNDEFNLLQAALNIEDGIDGLRYNKIIIATDTDVDGMHIRLLLITFFLQFFPDLIKEGHVFILQTPLFRVRNKRKSIYCYSDEERVRAIDEMKSTAEITRFKGLGEISPEEFRGFIGSEMRLEPVLIQDCDNVPEILSFFMGKNTMERQNFIINNLKIEEDQAENK